MDENHAEPRNGEPQLEGSQGSEELAHIKDILSGLDGDKLRTVILSLSLFSQPIISNEEDYNLRMLTRMVLQLNENIEQCTTRIAQSYHRRDLSHRLSDGVIARFPERRNSTMVDLIRFGIENGAMGVDIIIPSLQHLFNVTLVHHIFKPFLPGLDPESDMEIFRLYRRISRNGVFLYLFTNPDTDRHILESPERRSMWRTISYLHADPCRNDEEHAKYVTNEVLATVRDFVSTLLPQGIVGTIPTIFTSFGLLIKDVVLDAIEVQDHIRTKCLSHDCEIFLPSPRSPFDPTVMNLAIPKVLAGNEGSQKFRSGSWKTGKTDVTVLVGSSLGLRSVTGRDVAQVLVEANVICG